jgi:hypothetical protein
MYWSTTPVSYPRRRTERVDIDAAIKASKSKGEPCVSCAIPSKPGNPIISGEYRVGTKLLGKTVRVESCIECAKAFRDLLDLRIKEAGSP